MADFILSDLFLGKPLMEIYRLSLPVGTFACLLMACSQPQPEDKTDAAAPPPIKATAQLFDATGAQRGAAVLTENGGGLKLQVTAEDLASGTYGIHLHMVGKCEGPKYESAGSHWNPASKEHGLENPNGAHRGDLPNMEAVASKPTEYSRDIKDATLSSGNMAVLDADGTAIVIHAKPDDYKTDPSGNSGDRIVCGVFALG